MNLSLIDTVRKINPLVHNMTNFVVANDTANGLLAIGASPFMSNAIEEVAEIQTFNHALVLNIGTIHDEQFKAMIQAGIAANQNQKPVVIDPVGAGATTYRKQVMSQLLDNVQPTLIRGNAGELACLAEIPWEAKGVDVGTGQVNVQLIAETVAKKCGCLVFISGETDVITDGSRTYLNHNGTPSFTQITGSGCLLSAICAAYLGALQEPTHNELLDAVIVAGTVYSITGEIIAKDSPHTNVGTFRTALLDQLATINQTTISPLINGEWSETYE